MDEAVLRKAVPWLAGALVVPAGLAAAGVPWLVIFAVSLMLTLVVAAGAYPAWRTWLLGAVVAAGALSIWSMKREVDYGMKWMLCHNQRYKVVDGDLRLLTYWIGMHPINDNHFDLWMKSDEQTFSLAGKTVGGELSDAPTRLPSHNDHFLNWTRIIFNPPVKLTDAGEGSIRYVVRFGRTPENLDKTIIVSGRVSIEYPPDGDTVVGLRPDPDSSVPATGDECVVPAV